MAWGAVEFARISTGGNAPTERCPWGNVYVRMFYEKKDELDVRAFHGGLLGITLQEMPIESNQNGGFD
jgi:hypothetical protein